MGCVRPLESAALSNALAVLLATPNSARPAPRAEVNAFLDYLNRCGIRWRGWRYDDAGTSRGLFLLLLLPGHTGVVMVPTPGEHGIVTACQHLTMEAGLARLRDQPLHFVQALLESRAAGQARLLQAFGFARLAALLYLERDALYPWFDPPPATAEWLRFGPATRAEFAATLRATYQDSLDFPELTGLRPMEDILLAHQSSGGFHNDLWEIARLGGQNAGCALLAPLLGGAVLEVVYMGVAPEFRGREVGSLLLRRALQHCRETGARRLTLAVDDRNAPAKQLYERFGFKPTAARDAYLLRPPQ